MAKKKSKTTKSNLFITSEEIAHSKEAQKKLKKSDKLTDKEIVEKYIGDLEHFFATDLACGWPIKLNASHKELVKLVPALKIKDNLLVRDYSKKFDENLLNELWLFRYNELNDRYNDLYNQLRELVNKY